jgi:hypothetical protein
VILHAEAFCASHKLDPIIPTLRLSDGTPFPVKALLASGMFEKPGSGEEGEGSMLTTTAEFAAEEGMLTSQELCVVATFLEEEIPEGAVVVVAGGGDEEDEAAKAAADAEILRQREEQARAAENEVRRQEKLHRIKKMRESVWDFFLIVLSYLFLPVLRICKRSTLFLQFSFPHPGGSQESGSQESGRCQRRAEEQGAGRRGGRTRARQGEVAQRGGWPYYMLRNHSRSTFFFLSFTSGFSLPHVWIFVPSSSPSDRSEEGCAVPEGTQGAHHRPDGALEEGSGVRREQGRTRGE